MKTLNINSVNVLQLTPREFIIPQCSIAYLTSIRPITDYTINSFIFSPAGIVSKPIQIKLGNGVDKIYDQVLIQGQSNDANNILYHD